MDRFDNCIRCSRQEATDEMRAGYGLRLGATVVFELGPDARAELHFIVMLARVERVEIGNPSRPNTYSPSL